MGMFDNIIFDEFTLLEGEQAEAYKKRKEEEKEKEKNRVEERLKRRINNGYGDQYTTKYNPNYKYKNYHSMDEVPEKEIKDTARGIKAERMGEKYMKNLPKNKRGEFNLKDDGGMVDAVDGANRHIRRHPKQYIKDLEMINREGQ